MEKKLDLINMDSDLMKFVLSPSFPSSGIAESRCPFLTGLFDLRDVFELMLEASSLSSERIGVFLLRP